MQNTRILVIGRIGQVGWELRHKLACLGQVTAIEYPEVDFSRPDSIRTAVRAAQPAVVINAAAYTAVDKAEDDPELAMAINGTAPGVLAEEAKRLGGLLVHYSTDYVFDGTKQGAYLEGDAPNPVNVYGRTKLAGDEAIQAVDGEFPDPAHQLGVWRAWKQLPADDVTPGPGTVRVADCGRPDRRANLQRMHRSGYCRCAGAVACACWRWTGWTQWHLQPDQHGRDLLVRICKGVVDPIGGNFRVYGSQPDPNQDQRLSSSRQTPSQLSPILPTAG